jgi:hypothetical protein
MMPPLAAAYTRTVHKIPGTAAALALLVFLTASTAAVSAAPTLVEAGNAPVVVVRLTSGTLTIRTWNRNQVQIDTQGTANWFHATPQQVANTLPLTQNMLAQTAQTMFGPVTLPPETFIDPPLAPGPHEGVRIVGQGTTTILVPQNTALILARVGAGNIHLQGYRGAFLTAVHTGNVVLNNVGGTGFVQAVKGRVFAGASSFDRIRVRTGIGNIAFEGCTAQQIEVTSIRGSVVYDNGSFTPGLARFESQYGNIALGIGAGGAQVSAHAASGRIFTDFSGRSNVSVAGGDARGQIGGGGATVTASANNGALLLYDGSLRSHPNIAAHAPAMRAFINRASTLPARRSSGIAQRRPGIRRKGRFPPH